MKKLFLGAVCAVSTLLTTPQAGAISPGSFLKVETENLLPNNDKITMLNSEYERSKKWIAAVQYGFNSLNYKMNVKYDYGWHALQLEEDTPDYRLYSAKAFTYRGHSSPATVYEESFHGDAIYHCTDIFGQTWHNLGEPVYMEDRVGPFKSVVTGKVKNNL